MDSKTTTRILYITDIHFSAENRDNESVLIDKLISRNSGQLIDVMVIGGDVVSLVVKTTPGLSKEDELAEAEEKRLNNVAHAIENINRIISGLGLTGNDVYICAGNHDVNRDEIKEDVNAFVKDATNVTTKEIQQFFLRLIEKTHQPDSSLQKRHRFFEQIVEQTGANKFEPASSLLYGSVIHPKTKIRFTVYNSSWLCGIMSLFSTALPPKIYATLTGSTPQKWPLASEDRSFLLLGQTLIDELQNLCSIKPVDALESDDLISISIIHHPPSWMNHREVYLEAADAVPNYDKIINTSHIILCGHEHPLHKTYDILRNKSILITGAALIPKESDITGLTGHSYHVLTIDKVNHELQIDDFEVEGEIEPVNTHKVSLFRSNFSMQERLNKAADKNRFEEIQQIYKNILISEISPLLERPIRDFALVLGSTPQNFAFMFDADGETICYCCIEQGTTCEPAFFQNIAKPHNGNMTIYVEYFKVDLESHIEETGEQSKGELFPMKNVKVNGGVQLIDLKPIVICEIRKLDGHHCCCYDKE